MVISKKAALLDAVIDSGLTVSEAAQRCGVNRDLFGALLRTDRAISVKTAGRLKRHFGDDVISTEPRAEILKG